MTPLFYKMGRDAARTKLGTGVGTIAYAPREGNRNPQFDYTANKRDDLWREFDEEPHVTGEESSLGMPSAGVKSAGLSDGGYGSSTQEIYGVGGTDANQALPDKDLRNSSAIEEAFKANEDYDQSYGEEPPATQPHGSRYASDLSNAGITPVSTTPKAPQQPGASKLKLLKTTDPRGDKPPGMNLQHAVSTLSSNADSTSSIESPAMRQQGGSV